MRQVEVSFHSFYITLPIIPDPLFRNQIKLGLYRNWTVANAIDALRKFEKSAAGFGNTPWEHSEYFANLRNQLNEYNSRIEKARLELYSLISENNIVKRNLKIFKEAGGIRRTLNGEESEKIKYKSR